MKRRVVVTGIGVISPLGTGLEAFWTGLKSGKSGISTVEAFDISDYPTKIGGEVRDFNPADYIDKKDIRRMDRCVQFAVSASRMAIEDSNLKIEGDMAERIGVFVGTGIGGIRTFEDQARTLVTEGPRRVSPAFIPMMIPNMVSGHISIIFGAKGPNLCIITACATGTHSIGEAMKVIERGDADVMITGGTEAPITPLAYAGFCSLRALSTRNSEPERASRPFDRERDGFVMSEGAGVLILEELEHARRRGAKIYGEIRGFGMCADAHHIVAPAPDGEGAGRAIRLALADAGVDTCDVDYVNAHGTSTDLNDKYETAAIRKVFGEHAERLAVSSIKSMTGHLLGAAGAVEAIACLMTIRDGIIPPTINYENPDPECDLDYVPNKAREAEVNIAISNSFGFGGHNAVLVFEKYRNDGDNR